MRRFLAFLLFVAVIPGLRAAEKPFATGKIVSVEDKVNTRVLYYQVNTPITRDDPYYEVAVQVKDTIYLGVYTPRHSKDLLPPEWLPGAQVRVRLEEKHMFLLKPTGTELELPIAKRTFVKTGDEPSPPSPKQ